MFYAAEYIHGSNVKGGTVKVHHFAYRVFRNDFVKHGSAYTGAGERVALKANSQLVKSAKEQAKHGVDWPIVLID